MPPKQEQRPATDEVTEVAPGVLRTQLPIDFTGLGHVNMYVLLDDEGAAVVDPGMPLPDCYRAIGDRLRRCGLRPEQIHTVVVTHSHPDHFGGAGKLAEDAGAAVVAHRTFQLPGAEPEPDLVSLDHDDHLADLTIDDRGAQVPWRPPEERITPPFDAVVTSERTGFARTTPTRRVDDGDAMWLAGRRWVAWHTPGHTGDHLCLHDPDSGLLIAGDHVLPSITPHISGMRMAGDPLDTYMASLERVGRLPDPTLVLPAHGDPFTGPRHRVDAILAHHRERLDRLRVIGAALGPAPVSAYARELFPPHHQGLMAESETFAHLHHLVQRGEVVMDRRTDAVLFAPAALR